MSMKRWFAVQRHSAVGDSALLVIRLVGGVGLMMHGWPKIQNPFAWMGPDGFAPGFMQALAALSEFGGGLAWILGLLVPLASAGIAATMAGAVWFHVVMRGDPFVATGGNPSYELAALYLCVALVLAAIGPGRFSADRMVFGSRR